MIVFKTRKRAARRALFFLGLALLAMPALAGEPASTELAYLVGTFTGSQSEAQPIERGPLTIHVSSPEYRLTVHRNRFGFAPTEGGLWGATVDAEFEGTGELAALVESPGGASRFNDRLTLPRQNVAIAGKIRLERTEGGYLVTLVEVPETVAIEIRSDALDQIGAACDALAKLPFLPISCAGLDDALAHARLPLPEPGETFLLEEQSLTPQERAFFDELLQKPTP